MASMFLSLLDRAETLPAQLRELFSRLPSTSSSSSTSSCSQIVEDLERLRRRMERIRALHEDAEEREIRENRVRRWLEDLRGVACEAEDVMAGFEYELQRGQLACKEEEQTAIITPEKRAINKERELQIIANDIKNVNKRFKEIHEDGLVWGLHGEGRQIPSPSPSEPPLRRPMGCFVDEEGVRGRESDKHEVMKILLSKDDDGRPCNESVRVVSIVGMAGVGKTTLAQLVYNDEEVRGQFNRRLWIDVSESFDVTRLMKEIIEAIVGSCGIQGFSLLQDRLRWELEGKRFLLVLDDVWNEIRMCWDRLWLPLSCGAEGSRVLITTRSEKVSRISGVSAANMYKLECLSDEHSWSPFERQAFGGGRSSDYPNLVRIGQQIVKRCDGLPLAVKALAGLLFCGFREESWKDVLISDLWEIPEGKVEILPALKLSYHHLPSAIKPCFAYCAVFPKNHNFDRDELVLMWMAQGYLNATPGKRREEVGRQYFEDLLQRSIFQEHGKGYIMHDLTHCLALFVWGRKYCEVGHGALPRAEARHVSFECVEDYRSLLSAGPVLGLTRLRTFGLFKLHPNYTCSTAVVNSLLLSMKYLHVLDLHGVEISELPESVGNLLLLRYLRIGRSQLCRLPEAMGNLRKLQTLDVSEASGLIELPEGVKELENLRHLKLHVAGHAYGGLSRMPRGIGRLTQLRTLPRFVVGEGSGAAGIQELTGLNHLWDRLEITIRSLENWDRNKKKSILKGKRGLQSLALVFQCRNESAGSAASMKQQHEELMESLQPHTNIKELELVGSRGGRVPTWMQVPPGRRAGASPPFPWLENLCLHLLGLEGTLTLGAGDGGTFPRLRKLKIQNCYSLRSVELQHLAALTKLRIDCCPALTGLDCRCDESVSLRGLSPSSSGSQQRQEPPAAAIVVDHILQMPVIHTIRLRKCPQLKFHPLPQRELQLSPSLRKFDFTDSPLLEDWLRDHVCILVSSRHLHVVIRCRSVVSTGVNDGVSSESEGEDLDDMVALEDKELRWEDDPPSSPRRKFPPRRSADPHRPRGHRSVSVPQIAASSPPIAGESAPQAHSTDIHPTQSRRARRSRNFWKFGMLSDL